MNQRRSEILKIRLTAGERLDLDEASARLGKSVSEFVRETALHQAAIVNSVDADEEEPEQGILIPPAEHDCYQQFKLAELQRIRDRVRIH